MKIVIYPLSFWHSYPKINQYKISTKKSLREMVNQHHIAERCKD